MYCGQTGHCTKGMVFAVNPTQEKSLAAFKAAALAKAPPASAAAAAPPAATTLAAIQQNPPAQVASTLTFGTDAGLAAQAAATVAAGQGSAANGQTCACSCLCGGSAVFPMANGAGVGNFGGIAGE